MCQLLQDSTRHQFFLNIQNNLLNGKYQCCKDLLAKLQALLTQAFSGDFHENDFHDFSFQVLLQHFKVVSFIPLL